ncbi:MAG: SLATT domain-containing protein [Erythrobacter sp.]
MDMKATAGSRFIASERLKSKDRLENLTVAFLSTTVIAASLIPILFELDKLYQTSVLLGVLVSSILILILILILSMRIYAEKNSVEAEELKRSALEVSSLRRQALASNLEDNRTYKRLAQQYSDILDKFSINHLEKDYLAYKRKHPWEFEAENQSGNAITNLPSIQNAVEKLFASVSLAAAAAAAATLIGQF